MKIDLVKINEEITESFNDAFDLTTRNIRTDFLKADIIFLDGMLNGEELDRSILDPLIKNKGKIQADLNALSGILTCNSKISETAVFDDMIKYVAAGDAALLIEGESKFIILNLRRANGRAVEEPPTSAALKGPREGFIEDIKTNLVLIRRILRTSELAIEKFTIGRYTATTVCICYLKSIAMPDVIERVRQRLNDIDIDGIIDSSIIARFLESKTYSLFKQIGNSEKPDVIANKMLDGKVAILVDGSPIALTLPYVMSEDFEDVQDNYKRVARVTFLRFIRYIGIMFAVLLPALYVAMQTYHYQMIPPQLLVTLLNAVEGIPFRPMFEMLIAVVLFEILGEASIRMPRFVGISLSVVGALVLGDTAVKAGVLSSITVLIVALSGIGIYTVPDEVGSLSIMRFLFICIGGLFGIFGLVILFMLVATYLLSFEEYGVPYLAPIVPFIRKDFAESMIKVSRSEQVSRPEYMDLDNKTRLVKRNVDE